jgi:glycosyltransferase involved in cell wall biosynthesis
MTGEPEAMPSDTLVSVVIPTHNRARTLGRAIRSVLAQTHGDLECIVVDDCSTDDTAAVVEAIDDPRLRYIPRERNGGAGAARNTGVAAARGHFIAFQDSDDEWLLDKLAHQVAAMRDGPETAVGVYCAKIVYGIDRDAIHGGRRASVVPDHAETGLSGDIKEPLRRRNVISTQTLMVTAEAATRVGGFDEKIKNSVDWDYVLRLSELGEILFVDEPLAVAYRMEDSISLPSRRSVFSMLRIANRMKRRGVDRRVVAGHVAGLGTRLGYYGKPVLGRRLIAWALRARPTSWRLWARYGASFLPGATRAVSSRVKKFDVAADR